MTFGQPNQRVILVATNINSGFGGESMLPLQYFRLLRRRGVDVLLVCHERNRADLTAQCPDDIDRLHFVADRRVSRLIHRAGWRLHLPTNVEALTTFALMDAIAVLDLRRKVRGLVRESEGRRVVVHAPIPVSPRQPLLMSRVGAPVVVGPLNGGMSYPPAFRHTVPPLERLVRQVVRHVSGLANALVDGKGRASTILVANPRTRRALPRFKSEPRIEQIAENGVDLTVFKMRETIPTGLPRFAFVGRLVDWKRVDLLIDAMATTPDDYQLEIIGTGTHDDELKAQTAGRGLDKRITFHGLLTQDESAAILATCNALVLPSVFECGGAVVLEAMAVGLPVIATDWGGPADYVINEETGVLIAPDGPGELTTGLAKAMRRLATDRPMAVRMGELGRRRVEEYFDWDRKIDAIEQVYAEAKQT